MISWIGMLPKRIPESRPLLDSGSEYQHEWINQTYVYSTHIFQVYRVVNSYYVATCIKTQKRRGRYLKGYMYVVELEAWL